MTTFRTLIAIIAVVLFASSCTKSQDQALISIPLPADSAFEKALAKSLRSTSLATASTQLRLAHAVINASGPGLREQVTIWNERSGVDRPNELKLAEKIPFGKDRLFQALFVFENTSDGKLTFFYGDAIQAVSTPLQTVVIDLDPLPVPPTDKIDLYGRFFFNNSTQPVQGQVTASFQPPIRNGIARRRMSVERSALVNGWGKLFALSQIPLTYTLNDGTIIYQDVSAESSIYAPSQRVAQINVPNDMISKFEGGSVTETRTIERRNLRVGYFGLPSTARNVVCLPEGSQLLTHTLPNGNTASLHLSSDTVNPIDWVFGSNTSGQLGSTGGAEDSNADCSSTTFIGLQNKMKFDLNDFIRDPSWQTLAFGFDGIWQALPHPEHLYKGTVVTEVLSGTNELKLTWQTLPGINTALSGYDVFLVAQLADEQSENACESAAQASSSQRLFGPLALSANETTTQFGLPAMSVENLTALVCAKSSVSGRYFEEGTAMSRVHNTSGVTPPPPVNGIQNPIFGSTLYGSTTLEISCNPIETDLSLSVSIIPQFIQIASGATHTCGIQLGSQQILCWGDNGNGQLGDGTTTHRAVPTPLQASFASMAFAQVSAGGNTTCAITSTGTMLCWGSNSYGQIGDSTNTARFVPTALEGSFTSTLWTKVDVGSNSTCAIRNDGRLFCWGQGSQGQLGFGNTFNSMIPQALTTSGGFNTMSFIDVSVGGTHVCGINSLNIIYCWGSGAQGQLGRGTSSNSSIPIQLHTSFMLTEWSQITTGNQHTCAIRLADSLVFCWGANINGQLGDGTTIGQNIPTPLDAVGSWDVTPFVKLHTTQSATCGLRQGAPQKMACWGNNSFGQLGHGDLSTINSSPRDLLPSTEWQDKDMSDFTVGQLVTCGLLAPSNGTALSGTAVCFGREDLIATGSLAQVANPLPGHIEPASGSSSFTTTAFACPVGGSLNTDLITEATPHGGLSPYYGRTLRITLDRISPPQRFSFGIYRLEI